MIICSCFLHLELYDAISLKGRRKVLNSIKERLKSFNVSVLDVSGEYVKEAEIAFIFLSRDASAASRYREKIEAAMERAFPEYAIDLEYELL